MENRGVLGQEEHEATYIGPPKIARLEGEDGDREDSIEHP